MSLSSRNNLRKLTEPWKEPSQEPQIVPQHAHLHHLESSPSFQALTRISFPSGHSEELKPEECAHKQHLTPYPSVRNAAGNSYVWAAERNSSPCVSLLSQQDQPAWPERQLFLQQGTSSAMQPFLKCTQK